MQLLYEKTRYRVDDTLAIMAYKEDPECGIENYGMVTVNVSEYYDLPRADDIVVLPKYKMSSEFYETVVRDLVEKNIGPIQIGYGIGEIVQLKNNWEENVRMISYFNAV